VEIGLMCRTIWLVLPCLTLLLTAGCATSKKQAAVKGTVTLESRPLADGEISFVVEGRGPIIMQIQNGAYSGEVPVGANRVEIRAFKPGPPLSTDPKGAPTKVNYIPARFNDRTTLKAEVTADGPDDFPFSVDLRPESGSAPRP
jgi:hypothetical protein